MKLNVQYFALLREQSGTDAEFVETDATTPAALYEELRTRHGFTLESRSLKVAINDDFAPWSAKLSEGDSIVFIPPVAGG